MGNSRVLGGMSLSGQILFFFKQDLHVGGHRHFLEMRKGSVSGTSCGVSYHWLQSCLSYKGYLVCAI